MFSKGWLVVLLALVTCVVGRFSSSSAVDAIAANPNIVQGRYIVETSSQSVLGQLGDKGNQVSCQRRY